MKKITIPIIALFVLSLFALTGCDLFNGGDNETVGLTQCNDEGICWEVSEEPIRLIVMDTTGTEYDNNKCRSCPDARNRLKNLVDGSNKATITGDRWYVEEIEGPGGTVNLTLLFFNTSSQTNITMDRNEYYPERIDVAVIGALTLAGADFNFAFGKENYAQLLINGTKAVASQPGGVIVVLNTTAGPVTVDMFPFVNVSSWPPTLALGGLWHFIIDSYTGQISAEVYNFGDCMANNGKLPTGGYLVFNTSITPWNYTDTSGEVKITITNGDALSFFAGWQIAQNPLVGQYHQMMLDYCQRVTFVDGIYKLPPGWVE